VLELEGSAWAHLYEYDHDYGDQGRQATVELLDAYGRFYLAEEALRIQLGQFKKPFSRIRMESPWDLLLPVRGLLNRHAISKTRYAGYGGRDVGLMVSGRFKEMARLAYYLGVFSGPRYVDRTENSNWDYVARLQVRPFKGLRVAVNASHKVYHYKEGGTLTDKGLVRGASYTGNLFGADVRYKLGDLTLLIEGAMGDNVNFGPGHVLWGAHGTVAYALGLSDELVLTPAVTLEWFDPTDQDELDPAMRIAGALNLDIGEIGRLVVFADGASGEVTSWISDTGDGVGGYVTQRPATRVFIQVNMAF
jgi:hypothetical protein